MNEELLPTDEVCALDHYLDETTWHSKTGELRSYNYGVDIRVANVANHAQTTYGEP